MWQVTTVGSFRRKAAPGGAVSRFNPEYSLSDPVSLRGSTDSIGNCLALLDSLRQAERRAAISRVASVIGHLIGTPLNVIAGRAALIRANPDQESSKENARRIEEQVERLAGGIRRLIDSVTAPEPRPEPRAADVVVAEALALYEPIAERHGIAIVPVSRLPSTVLADGTTALVVLTSLLSLALRVPPRGKRVELRSETMPQGGVAFELRIPGLLPPKSRLDRLDPPEEHDAASAERFQLLSLCYAMAKRRGGHLEVVTEEPSNAAIRFECPGASP